jgi:hypothetical protein
MATVSRCWRQQTRVFQDVAAYRFNVVNLTGTNDPEQIAAGQVSADFFRLFGAPVIAGRTFTADAICLIVIGASLLAKPLLTRTA